jgi:5-methylcytosine-specific restriction endonuclease McrA
MNLVAACYECNSLKADRTPAEAGMVLYVTPHVPRAEYARAIRHRAARAA